MCRLLNRSGGLRTGDERMAIRTRGGMELAREEEKVEVVVSYLSSDENKMRCKRIKR